MKKIVIVNQHYYPELASTAQVFQEIAEHFAKEGYKVQVVAGMPFYHDNINTNLKIKKLNNVHICRLWNTTFTKNSFIGKVINLLTFQISLLVYMIVAIDRKAIVLVGTNPPMGIVCGALAKALRRFKLIGVIQDLYPDILVSSHMTQDTSSNYRILSRIMKYSFSKCNKVVTISHDMKEHIERTYKVNKVEMINNMVIGDIFPIENYNLKEKAGFQDHLVVMYSGNFGVAHEYETLLETTKLLRNNSQIVFYIVGGGINYNKLKAACKDEGLTHVVFKPYVDKEKLNESLNLADVHITIFNDEFKNVLMPSKYYGILACAKPIILITDGANDISRDINKYQIGIVIRKGDAQTLAGQLVHMLDEPKSIKAMSQAASTLYKEKYAKEVVLQKYSKVVKAYE